MAVWLRRSRKGAWIEIHSSMMNINPVTRRSRKGAWIEILAFLCSSRRTGVAPVRERGLKFRRICSVRLLPRRSRKGAWIEIAATGLYGTNGLGRSRKGAWIEILA